METNLYDLPKDMLIKLITTLQDIKTLSDQEVQQNYSKYKAEIVNRKCLKIKEYLLSKVKDEDSVSIIKGITAIGNNHNEDEMDITIVEEISEKIVTIRMEKFSSRDIRAYIFYGEEFIGQQEIMSNNLMGWHFFSKFPDCKRYENFIDLLRHKFNRIYNYLIKKDNLIDPIKFY
jgi:hypothetical protein